jgi:hypothetical protein
MAVVMAFLGATAPSRASELTYSGSGFIYKSGTADPWNIGPNHVPITFSISIPSTASDIDTSVEGAEFQPIDSGTFVIDGTPTLFKDVPSEEDVQFIDNNQNIADSFTARFVASRNGVDETFGITYYVSQSTFTFTQQFDSPPVYSNQTVTQTVIQGSTHYSVQIPSGSTVDVSVPEPSSLLAIGLIGCGLPRRRRR